MLDLLPDLSGQPAWVVIVVVALLMVGTVGAKWAGRGARDGQEEDDQEPDRSALPPAGHGHTAMSPSDAHTTAVLTKALDLLANEAAESQGARVEVDRLRAELVACSTERDRIARDFTKVQADLEQCNRECRRLAMRALERGGNSGE